MNRDVFRTWALVLQLGISMLVPILLLVAIGHFLKEKFSIDAMLFCVIFGTLVGIRNVCAIVKNYLSTIDKNKSSESELMKKHMKNIKNNGAV